jgi:alpha-ketoglutarate-dependent taurine dioxygenase
MFPANRAARELRELLDAAMASHAAHTIAWRTDEAIAVANWTTLHGRGPAPEGEKERVIERIYVR